MNETDRNAIDRQRGALLGLAVGDALGAAIEFQPPSTFEPVTGYRAGGPHGLAPGEWTDDTSMALVLANSIAEAKVERQFQLRKGGPREIVVTLTRHNV
jgi:ADP-ribosyl-[dinitrogen reductase] hydrolase